MFFTEKKGQEETAYKEFASQEWYMSMVCSAH